MGRKPLPVEERKSTITLRLKNKSIIRLRQIKNYNALVDELFQLYLEMLNESDNLALGEGEKSYSQRIRDLVEKYND